MRIIKSLFCASIYLILLVNSAFAAPIYVVKNRDGSQTFTSKKPAAGLSAKVFTARSAKFSFYRGSAQPWRRGKLFPAAYKTVIDKEAGRHGVDPSLIKAVIHAESAFNPRAISPKGAIGLMQLMPATARMHGINPYRPEDNIKGGVKHLGMLLQKYRGNLNLSLAAYNAGEGAVQSYGGIPPYKETQNYVTRVLHLAREYRKLGGSSY